MAQYIKSIFLILAGVMVLCADPSVAGPIQQEAIGAASAARLRVRQPGEFVYGLRFADKQGQHLLLLTAQDSASGAGRGAGRIDQRRLWAASYRLDAAKSWQREWQIADGVSCPDLDSEALFLLSGVAVTDLDHDSMAEVTIPYRKFCGGGIDTKDVVVALRTGRQAFALRGQSLLVIPGQAPIGGEHEPDAALQQARFKAFRDHLESTWSRVAREEIGGHSKGSDAAGPSAALDEGPGQGVLPTKGAPFLQFRSQLIKDGWRPVHVHAGENDEFVGVEAALIEAKIDEVESCAFDRALCIFNYQRGKRCLRVIAAGEELPSLSIESWSSQCPAPRPSDPK